METLCSNLRTSATSAFELRVFYWVELKTILVGFQSTFLKIISCPLKLGKHVTCLSNESHFPMYVRDMYQPLIGSFINRANRAQSDISLTFELEDKDMY